MPLNHFTGLTFIMNAQAYIVAARDVEICRQVRSYMTKSDVQ